MRTVINGRSRILLWLNDATSTLLYHFKNIKVLAGWLNKTANIWSRTRNNSWIVWLLRKCFTLFTHGWLTIRLNRRIIDLFRFSRTFPLQNYCHFFLILCFNVRFLINEHMCLFNFSFDECIDIIPNFHMRVLKLSEKVFIVETDDLSCLSDALCWKWKTLILVIFLKNLDQVSQFWRRVLCLNLFKFRL